MRFNPTHGANNRINFLDLQIIRNTHKLEIDIFRKPRTTDNTIDYTPNHRMEHKTSSYRYYISRMHPLPLIPNRKQVEWTTIQTIAKINGFSTTFMERLNQQIQHNHNNKDHTNNEQHTKKIRTTLTYYSPLVRKITNLFKHTNIQISFKTTNTVQHLTQPSTHQKPPVQEKIGIYKLTCNTSELTYIGQTSRSLQQKYNEHIRYIKHNDPQSVYALHILNNRHEYGKITDTMTLLKHITDQTMLLPYEQMFIKSYHHHEHLIPDTTHK